MEPAPRVPAPGGFWLVVRVFFRAAAGSLGENAKLWHQQGFEMLFHDVTYKHTHTYLYVYMDMYIFM